MKERVKVFDEKMTKAYNHLLGEYQTIRAGRANPHVLDKIKVDYYGTPTPLQQVGNISVPEPRMLQIAPWEKSLIREIEKLPSVESVSGMGLMIGIKLKEGKTSREVAEKCLEKGLLVLTAHEKVRLLPPLNITKEELDKGLSVLKEVLK